LKSAAERRHLRVKNWTRNINIFEKDFVVVPINKNAHWYLAIICYPYLLEPEFEGEQIDTCKQEESISKNDEIDDIENESKLEAKRPKLASNEEMEKINDQEPIESIDEADEDDLTDNIDLIENDPRLCKKRYYFCSLLN
jgi:sentrin-specific protease 7